MDNKIFKKVKKPLNYAEIKGGCKNIHSFLYFKFFIFGIYDIDYILYEGYL